MSDERTSEDVAKKAARVMRDLSASPDAKSAAASALNQTADREAGDSNPKPQAGDLSPSEAPPPAAGEPFRFEFAPLDPEKDERGRARKQSPVVEINNGDYQRRFELKDQPFEAVGFTRKVKLGEGGEETVVVIVTPEEEAQMLMRTDQFVKVPAVAG